MASPQSNTNCVARVDKVMRRNVTRRGAIPQSCQDTQQKELETKHTTAKCIANHVY